MSGCGIHSDACSVDGLHTTSASTFVYVLLESEVGMSFAVNWLSDVSSCYDIVANIRLAWCSLPYIARSHYWGVNILKAGGGCRKVVHPPQFCHHAFLGNQKNIQIDAMYASMLVVG